MCYSQNFRDDVSQPALLSFPRRLPDYPPQEVRVCVCTTDPHTLHPQLALNGLLILLYIYSMYVAGCLVGCFCGSIFFTKCADCAHSFKNWNRLSLYCSSLPRQNTDIATLILYGYVVCMCIIYEWCRQSGKLHGKLHGKLSLIDLAGESTKIYI